MIVFPSWLVPGSNQGFTHARQVLSDWGSCPERSHHFKFKNSEWKAKSQEKPNLKSEDRSKVKKASVVPSTAHSEHVKEARGGRAGTVLPWAPVA